MQFKPTKEGTVPQPQNQVIEITVNDNSEWIK